MTNKEKQFRKEIVLVGKRMYQNTFVVATQGNISVRLSENEVLITPTGICLGDLKTNEISLIDLDNNEVRGHAASSESKMHIEILRRRPDIHAVIHSHPRFATAWAIARRPLPWKAHPEVVIVLGEIGLTSYHRPSSHQLAETIGDAMTKGCTCLLANHGSVTAGSDLLEAYRRLEILESFAHSCFIAEALGGPVELSDENLCDIIK